MSLRALWLFATLALATLACSEEVPLPPLEPAPPLFVFSQYLDEKTGRLVPHADLLLVRRPPHLEHVYDLAQEENAEGYAQAEKLFGLIERQFQEAGRLVADQAYSVRCMAVELPDCIPKWSFIEELMGPGDGPGARRLRQTLADSFQKRARELKMENTLVLATVNVLLTRGMMKSALGSAAAVEGRAAALAEQRTVAGGAGGKTAVPEPPVPRPAAPAAAPVPARPAFAPGSLPPSPELVQALTGKNPTPPVTPGLRLPQDVAVSPKVPKQQLTTRPIGPSPTQNAQLQVDLEYVRKLGATNIRVNQQQLAHSNNQRVGINRPDLQFDYKGRRYHVEYDTPGSGRGLGHQKRVTSNDPDAEVILLIVP